MALREIIRIDEEKCNGCGDCISACAEGALRLVDGKAKLVKEDFCDGFGDCIGECPTGALTIEKREADEFDFEATKEHVLRERGERGVEELQRAGAVHEMKEKLRSMAHGGGGGCPGSRMRLAEDDGPASGTSTPVNGGPKQAIPSDLRQWPIQLHLVMPGTEIFKNKELVVLSTCSPAASADVHWRFIRGRSVVIACPKLDRTEGYVDKMAAILSEPTIPKVIVLRMEVPCCGGLTAIVREAASITGRDDLEVVETVVGLNGDIAPTI